MQMLEAGLSNMATGGHISLCGFISGYNEKGDPVSNLALVGWHPYCCRCLFMLETNSLHKSADCGGHPLWRCSASAVQVLTKQLTMRGFLAGPHFSKFPQFRKEMTQWLQDGKIHVLEHHTDGLENIVKVP